MKTPWTDYGISRSNYYKKLANNTLPAKINGTDPTTGITYTETTLENFNKALPIVRETHKRIKRHNAVADALNSADKAATANLAKLPKFTKRTQRAVLKQANSEEFKQAMEQQAIGIREVRERAAMYKAKAKAKREAARQRISERTGLADRCFAHAQMCAIADKATPAVMKALLREAANLLAAANKALK